MEIILSLISAELGIIAIALFRIGDILNNDNEEE